MNTKKNDMKNETENETENEDETATEALPAAADQETASADQEKNTDRYAPDDHSAPDSEYFEFPGIEVKDRKVNRWLIAVYIILAIWSIYYLISFWNG